MNKNLFFASGPLPSKINIEIAYSHRSQKFKDLFKKCKLKLENQLNRKVLFIQGSASLAIECILSSITINKRILIISNGQFGERSSELFKKYSKKIIIVNNEIDAKKYLNKKIDFFYITQFETSNSKYNDCNNLVKICKSNKIISIVDCVSSYPYYKHPDCDISILSSAKQIGGLPVMGIVTYKPNIERILLDSNEYPGSLSLKKYIIYARENQTPHTSLIPQFISLLRKLDKLNKRTINKQKELINSNSKLFSDLKDIIIGEQISPVITFKVKDIKKCQLFFKKYNIEPYYNNKYMQNTIQCGMYNYSDKKIYIRLHKIIKDAIKKGII